MPEKIERITVQRYYGQTLSSIIWRRFKQPMDGLAERVLERNPGLAELGPVLPFGTSFDLIVPPADEIARKVPVLRLWGVSK